MRGLSKSRLAVLGAAGTSALLAGLVSVLMSTTMGRAETTAADAEERFLKIIPSDETEDAARAPHLGPAEASAAASAFFEEPAPDDAALAAMTPFIGKENVPIQSCGQYTPRGVYDELLNGEPSMARRMKSEVYGLLNLRQVLATGDCSCVGKVAAWEPVPLILAEFEKANGPSEPVDAYALRDQATRLRRFVERLCGSEF